MEKKPVFLYGGAAAVCAAGICIGTAAVSGHGDPKPGYYDYQGAVYYLSVDDYYDREGLRWFGYDSTSREWMYPYYTDEMPEELKTRKASESFYLGTELEAKYVVTDFSESDFSADMKMRVSADEGYYRFENDIYYHYTGNFAENWYIYCKAWQPVESKYLPSGLVHISLSDEYGITEDAVSESGAESFHETLYFRDLEASARRSKGYYRYDDRIYYYESDNDEYWYCNDDDQWCKAGEFDIPDEFRHDSLIDSYYCDTEPDEDGWISFEDSAEYNGISDSENEDDEDSYGFWDFASDWLFDWDSDDSWDYNDSDWDSDW